MKSGKLKYSCFTPLPIHTQKKYFKGNDRAGSSGGEFCNRKAP